MKLSTRKTSTRKSGTTTDQRPRNGTSAVRKNAKTSLKDSKRRSSKIQKEWQENNDSPVSKSVLVRSEIGLETKSSDIQPTRSSFAMYLREIAQENLLTIQEEWELAELIKNGDEPARERMIRANLRLVVKIARDYEGFGLPLLDLINEGNIGLMKAVDKFDPNKGAKFSTYSSWWIKQAIKRSLSNQSKTIRLPIHLVEKIAKLRNVANRLHDALGREPTDEEIASELEIAPSRVALMRRASARPLSLDDTVGD